MTSTYTHENELQTLFWARNVVCLKKEQEALRNRQSFPQSVPWPCWKCHEVRWGFHVNTARSCGTGWSATLGIFHQWPANTPHSFNPSTYMNSTPYYHTIWVPTCNMGPTTNNCEIKLKMYCIQSFLLHLRKNTDVTISLLGVQLNFLSHSSIMLFLRCKENCKTEYNSILQWLVLYQVIIYCRHISLLSWQSSCVALLQ